MSSPAYKVPLLLTSSALLWKSYTPPGAAAEEERVKPSGMERLWQCMPVLTMITKGGFALCCLSESAVIIASLAQDAPLSRRVLGLLTANGTGCPQITPQFLTGSALTISGALLRLLCYRTMGQMFTFELAMRKEHQLVTTGPYSVVRHPSYTGMLVKMIGAALVQFGPGSWLRECGWLDTEVGRWYFRIWLAMRAMDTCIMISRTVKEDGMLRARFGEAWSKWVRKTPYKLLPFIF